MSEPKKRLIIDTDVGIDDAVAIILALSDPSVQVVAITCCSGNVHLERMTFTATFSCFSASFVLIDTFHCVLGARVVEFSKTIASSSPLSLSSAIFRLRLYVRHSQI